MANFISKYFASGDVNTGRQIFIDIARTMAILGMVMIHLLDLKNCRVHTEYPDLYHFFFIITGGILSAPMFMFCMGVGITYSRNATYEQMKSRSGNLFGKAILLNVLRDVVPLSLLWLIVRSPELLHQSDIGLYNLDILSFAAMAFLLMAFLKKWNVPAWGIFILSLLMSLCATYVHVEATADWYIDFFVGLFFGVSNAPFEICFPIFTWFATVAAGYLFGTLYRRSLHPEKFLAVFAAISLPFFVGYTAWAYPRGLMLFGEDHYSYYYMNFFDTLYCISVYGVFLYIYHLISKVLAEPIKRVCGTISHNVNEFYMVHWVIIGLINVIYIYLGRVYGLCETFMLAASVIVCAYLISYSWCESKRVKVAPASKVAMILCLVAMLGTSCKHDGQGDDKRCNTVLSEWMYGVEYDDYDFDMIADYIDQSYAPTLGAACSEVRKGDFVGRNLDWYITNEVTGIIKVDAKDAAHASGLEHIADARYASVGSVGVTGVFTRDIAQSGEFNDIYMVMPVFQSDGINEKGLYVGLNVAPTGETSLDTTHWHPGEWGVGAAYTNPSSEYTYCVALINRILLDHAASVDEAIEIIKAINWYEPVNFPVEGMSQAFHWMIADKNKNCILEFLDNEPNFLVTEQVNDPSFSTIMTNFSNSVYQAGLIQNYACGYERYDEAIAAYDLLPATADGMKQMMQILWYSEGYTRTQGTADFRYSDVIPDDISYLDLTRHPEWKTDNQYMIGAIADEQNRFVNRIGWHKDDCDLWYTTHTAVYDLNSRCYQIMLHEGIDSPKEWKSFDLSASFAKPLEQMQ